ncbi:hypothetical protein HELRODRAFT_170851 [Helobdella robusta]|uniref:Uncharacterized protein n=1 Tax=Helobdella robusta TaxID=6412 RepID=T1F3I4_HELRO|nr:hypothetical protein HELRODRAFT_170851 [Helobdella robusta]ESO06831.1 hypothetical protein HELRODRAFT_170851 [Helobdella robusta]
MTSENSEGLARRPLNIVTGDSRLVRNVNSNLNHLSPNDAVFGRRSIHSSNASEILRRSSLNTSALCRHNSSESRRLSLSRDPVQPTSGSLSSLKCRSLPPENEEDDVIGSLTATQISCLSLSSYLQSGRPRSFTCSDLDAKKMKTKVRNRPPTPPPKSEQNLSGDSRDCSDTQFSRSFDSSFLGNIGTSSVLGRRSRHSSRDRLEQSNLDELLPVINES